jgi:glycosyltransferase involved in cell wall biosynthesis
VTYSVLDRGELRDRYTSADVLVFPTEWDEPFGLVPVEAMACGVPVVATGTGGSGEFLLDGLNCVLFPPGDSAGLADAVTRIAGDAALRARLVDRGFATAAELSVDRLADVFEEWHRAAADHFREGQPSEQAPLLDRIQG